MIGNITKGSLRRAALLVGLWCGAAPGSLSADSPGAVVIFPLIEVDGRRGVDTVIELANTSGFDLYLDCFYEESSEGCRATAFSLVLTPAQPLAWKVSTGRRFFPPSTDRLSSARFVPPVVSDPYQGTLQCTVVDQSRVPVARSHLIGHATIERRQSSATQTFDATAYPAVQLAAVALENPEPAGPFIHGGLPGRYESCASSLVVPHFFDGAIEPAAKASTTFTSLSVVPCIPSSLLQTKENRYLRYEIINEFEQRLLVVAPVQGCRQPGPLSWIDTDQSARSAFHVSVAGTLTGQTVVSARDGDFGLVGMTMTELRSRENPSQVRLAAANAFRRGQHTPRASEHPSLEDLPCTGDCGGDRTVSVDEIVLGLSIALGEEPYETCADPALGHAYDPDGDGSVTVDAILSALDHALNGCPDLQP